MDEPIVVPSSDSVATDDLDFPEVHPVAEHVFEHLYNQGGSLGFSLDKEDEVMASRARTLGKGECCKG